MMTLITVVTMTITSNTMHDENFEGWGRLYFFTLVDVGSMAGLENIPTVQGIPHHFLFFLLTKHQFFSQTNRCRIFALSCPFQQALETWSRLMIIRLMFLRLWALTICNYAQHANDADSKNKLWLIAKDRDICNILFTSFGSTQRSCLWLQSDISALLQKILCFD